MSATDRLEDKPEVHSTDGEISQDPGESSEGVADEVSQTTQKEPAPQATKRRKPASTQDRRKKVQGEESAEPSEESAEPKKKSARKPAKSQKSDNLTGYTPRLKQLYRNEVAQALQKDLNFSNPMDVPAITKVVVNIGMGESLTNPKAMESAQRDLTTITGQRPIVTKAKKSIAAFKIRQGMPIGLMVTLRGSYMYEFLDRLMNIALPRIRDFRGAPTKGFDGRGNYTLGMREHIVFPEIDYNAIDRIRGLQITIVTTAKTDDAARRLLTLMGLVFSKDTEAALA